MTAKIKHQKKTSKKQYPITGWSNCPQYNWSLCNSFKNECIWYDRLANQGTTSTGKM